MPTHPSCPAVTTSRRVRWPALALLLGCALSCHRSEAAVVGITDTGSTTIDGEAIFPHGFYVEERYDLAKIQNQVRTIGQAGFNLAYIQPDADYVSDAVFAEAQSRGLYLIYCPALRPRLTGNVAAMHPVIGSVKGKPALLGYSLGDDVNDSQNYPWYPRTIAVLSTLYADVSSYDPAHLNYVALGGGAWGGATFTAKRFDAPANEVYPINGGSPISLVYSDTANLVAKAAPWRQSPWTVVQTFNWAQNPDQRMPTPGEYYNMLYQAIAAGAKGIIYYSYQAGSATLPQVAPALWSEATRAAVEIRRLAPYLTKGRMSRQTLGTGLFATTWTHDDSVLVVVAHAGDYRSYAAPTRNPAAHPPRNPADTRTASIDLPTGTVGPATSPFSGRPTGMTVTGGKLTGTIRLLEVQVYLLSNPRHVAPV